MIHVRTKWRAVFTFTYSSNSHARSIGSGFGIQNGLGGHVVEGANVRFAINIGRVVTLNGLGNSKVDEFECSSDEQKVGRLQIRVDDSFFVNGVNGGEHLLPCQSNEIHIE